MLSEADSCAKLMTGNRMPESFFHTVLKINPGTGSPQFQSMLFLTLGLTCATSGQRCSSLATRDYI